ncbi:MAG: hypothetical protein HOJ35_10015 [Bdellovibrionales bacterium]|nr:hypothetical protein [Bdellovibrionales bacterium]
MKNLICSLLLLFSANLFANDLYGYSESFRDFFKLRTRLIKIQDEINYWNKVINIHPSTRERHLSEPLRKRSNLRKKIEEIINRTSITKTEKLHINNLLKLDIKNNFEEREYVVGYNPEKSIYTGIYGNKIHKSCMDLLQADEGSQKKYHIDGNNIDLYFNQVIGETMERMSSCQNKYSELSPYLNEWYYRFKDITFKCVPENSNEVGAAAWVSVLELENIMYLPYDTFLDMVGGYFKDGSNIKTDIINLIMHETLHLTKANHTNGEHNQVSPHAFSGSCDKVERSSDRVYLISALCSGSHMNVPTETFPTPSSSKVSFKPEELLFLKAKKCGKEAACLNIFNDHSVLYTLLGKSSSLPQQKSNLLCSKIMSQGKCLHKARQLEISPFLKKHLNYINNKLSKVTPQDQSDIPHELFRIFPDLKNEADDVMKSCTTSKKINFTDPNKWLFTTNNIKNKGQWKQSYNSSNECKSGNYTSCDCKLSDFKASIDDKVSTISIDLIDLSIIDYLGTPLEKEHYLTSYNLATKLAKNKMAQKLFGNNFLKSFLAATKKYAYDSPDFDCQAQFKSGPSNIRSIMEVNNPKTSCSK